MRPKPWRRATRRGRWRWPRTRWRWIHLRYWGTRRGEMRSRQWGERKRRGGSGTRHSGKRESSNRARSRCSCRILRASLTSRGFPARIFREAQVRVPGGWKFQRENRGKAEGARMSWREGWRTRGDDLRTFLADFVSFPSQLRRWIKSTYNEPLNKRSSKKYLSLSPHLHGSIATLI